MQPSDTTLRLSDTVSTERPSSLWLIWCDGTPPVSLAGGPLVLGRGVEGRGQLDAPGVSRRHSEIVRQGPLLVLRDLGSTNGTFLNGAPVRANALSEGDVIRLGDAVATLAAIRDDLAPPKTEEPIPGVLFGPALSEVLANVRKLAPGNLPVVIEGATGVGKEGIARALHQLSGRHGSLQAVNCGALPPGLAEAELFGHRKGAFTGAEHAGLGHIRAADGGTLFLDELYDLAPSVQAKLLRVLQDKQVVPLGETRAVSVDVRIVAASLVPLADLVATGRLREDLAARLAGVSLVIPPLSRRRADIPPLLHHFLQQHSSGRAPSVDAKLLEHLLLLPWPGNVRELELLARRLLALHGEEAVLKRSMADDLAMARSASEAPPRPTKRRSLHDADAELEKLRASLNAHGNMSRAAQEAGISRQRAYRLLGREQTDDE